MSNDGPLDNDSEEAELDTELWEGFRRHIRDLSPPPPPYESIARRTGRSLSLPWPSERTQERIGLVATAAAIVLAVSAVGWRSQTLSIRSADSDETTPPAATLVPFDPNEAPLCWLDLRLSPPVGTCSQGTLQIDDQGGASGGSSWQGVVSGLQLPPGWSAVTYHRHWNKPEPERTETQAFAIHPARDTPQSIDFYQTQFQVVRDPGSTNGTNCSQWPTATIFTQTEPVVDNELNDNMVCLYFTPQPSTGPLVLTPDHPAQSRSLLVRYMK